MSRVRLFVIFTCEEGIINGVYNVPHMPESYDDIRALEDFIKKDVGLTDVAILHYKKMKKIKTEKPEDKIRKELSWFIEQMEKRLQENDYKNGWMDCNLEYLSGLMKKKAEKVDLIIDQGSYSTVDLNRILKNSVDAANYAMMIADITNHMLEVRREWGEDK